MGGQMIRAGQASRQGSGSSRALVPSYQYKAGKSAAEHGQQY